MDVAATTHERGEQANQQPDSEARLADWQKIVDNLRDDEKSPLVLLLLQVIADQTLIFQFFWLTPA